MEIINRYVYAVTKRLPESQRQDIAQELRGLIEDMIEERTGSREPNQTDVEEVLLALGNPSELALKYGANRRYLISPELFTPYITILKIVFGAIAISMTVVFIIETFLAPTFLLNHLLGYIGSTITIGAQAFAWVTIGFAFAEFKGQVPNDLKQIGATKWKPSDLPVIPDRKKQIKRSESIIGIIFSIIGLVFIIFSNHLIGVFIFENDKLVKIIPLFNIDSLQNYLPFIYGLIVLGIIKECLKLIVGKWTKKLALYNLLINLLSLFFVLMIFRDQLIWNPTFIKELNQTTQIGNHPDLYGLVSKIWDSSRMWVTVIIIFTLSIDTITGYYKAFKK